MKKVLERVKSMSVEELESLKNIINEELEKQSKKYGVYAHDCMNSANHRLYFFLVPVKSIIVEVCGDNIEAYQITANGKELIDSAKTNAMSALIDKRGKIELPDGRIIMTVAKTGRELV